MNYLKRGVQRIAPGPYERLQALRTRRLLNRVTRKILDRYGPVVQDGPFAGMHFVSEAATGSITPKLVGSYEAELHDIIRALSSNDYAMLVNVGCAEGYYAIGLGKIFPSAEVVAFDIDANAQRICGEMASSNGVKVRVEGECTPERLEATLPRAGRSLIICDCEGAEMEILDPRRVPALGRSDILLELHDFINPKISAEMSSRFSPSHEIEIVDSTARDAGSFPAVAFLSPLERRIALAEFRPEGMQWAFMTPK